MFFFVLVLYKCKLSDSLSFISISNSLKENGIKADILIWDNSPEPQKLSSVDKEVWDFVKYRHCPENDGVSKAYNAGAVIANNLDRKWLILLDQDTEFNVDIIKKLYEIISSNHSYKILAPVVKLKNGNNFSPFIYKHKRGYEVNLVSNRTYSLSTYGIINSGMVIETKAFVASGGYNEKVKLDFADTQFIENFRKFYSEFFLFDSIAFQDFSNDEKDISKLARRFEIYCNCAKNCNKHTLKEHAEYFYTVFRHSVGLAIKTKKILFINKFLKHYLL